MKYKILNLPMMLLVLVITSCVNFKAVNDYAKNSKETVQAFNESDISLTGSYKHIALFRCMFNNLGDVEFLATDATCYDEQSLSSYKKSDSLVNVVNTVLEKYFLALQELSSDQSTSFELKSSNLEELLSDTTAFNISADQVSAAKGLTEKLTNAALSVYKRKKLASIISDVHNDLEQVLKMDSIILKDIRKNLLNNKNTNENLYQNQFSNANTIPGKIEATQNYLDENNKWVAKIEILEKYIAALGEMIKGHKELLDKGKKLSTKYVIADIAKYTTKIIEIRNEIKKLKDDE